MTYKNIKALESFKEIMLSGSATEAGKRLGITQSAVSRHISQLEAELNLYLFIRDGGRLTPTEEAKALNEEVDLALKSLERIEEVAAEIARFERSSLSIVAPPSFVEAILADLVSEFLTNNPGVKVRIDSRSQSTAAELVSLRSVDCGFVKSGVLPSGLSVRSIVQGETVCALPLSHPLSERDELSPKDLANEKLILLGKGSDFRWEIERAFTEAQTPINLAIETHSVSASCSLAASGVGIAIVNGLLAEHYRDQGLALVRFKPVIRHEYNIITASSVPPSRVAAEFISFLEKNL